MYMLMLSNLLLLTANLGQIDQLSEVGDATVPIIRRREEE
jgi:hypothetical protein